MSYKPLPARYRGTIKVCRLTRKGEKTGCERIEASGTSKNLNKEPQGRIIENLILHAEYIYRSRNMLDTGESLQSEVVGRTELEYIHSEGDSIDYLALKGVKVKKETHDKKEYWVVRDNKGRFVKGYGKTRYTGEDDDERIDRELAAYMSYDGFGGYEEPPRPRRGAGTKLEKHNIRGRTVERIINRDTKGRFAKQA